MALSLGEHINIATRPLHTTLNRLILSLLPLGLPPHASSPDLYAYGISHILPIYLAFETSFHDATSSPTTSPRIAALLNQLQMPALERSKRLEADLALLNRPAFFTPPKHLSTDSNPCTNSDLPPHLRSFLHHISTSTTAKPHLLLAYTWILYMALFSGGRYLRNQLRTANTQTWRIGPSPDQDPGTPLQFWCFEGDQDGEDLKAGFKSRVQKIGNELTTEEGVEVVAEGVEIMKRMIAVVQEIESTTGAHHVKDVDSDSITTQLLTLKLFLPFSILKMLGGWSRGFASGLGMGLGAVGLGSVA